MSSCSADSSTISSSLASLLIRPNAWKASPRRKASPFTSVARRNSGMRSPGAKARFDEVESPRRATDCSPAGYGEGRGEGPFHERRLAERLLTRRGLRGPDAFVHQGYRTQPFA